MRIILIAGRVTALIAVTCVVAVLLAVEAVSRDEGDFRGECF